MAIARPTMDVVQRWFPQQNVMDHVRPLYYEGSGAVIRWNGYEWLVPFELAKHIPYNPRQVPALIPRETDEDHYLALSVARIYCDGYRGGTTIPRAQIL